MKRQLDDIDSLVPVEVLHERDGAIETLSKVNESFAQIESLLLKKKRIDLAMNSEPQIKQKVLRIYIRHAFVAASASDKSHFLVHIEGLLLDNTIAKDSHLGSFFERVSVQTQSERKSSPNMQFLEWKDEDYALGSTADSFRAKVYADKSCTCKILLHRSTDVIARYNISDQLRAVLPYLRFDPTEEEVLVAMWQYLEVNGLFAPDKDKRYFKLNELLKEVLLGDRNSIMTVMMISAMRSKVLPHLLLARPIAVDHYLNVTNTPEIFEQSLKANFSLSGGGRWPTSIMYARTGGRVFEVDVDMRDLTCFATLAALNKCTALEFDSNDRIRTQMEKLAYLAKKMQSLHQERTALTQALASLTGCNGAERERSNHGEASGKRTGNGDEVEVEVESVAQKALRVACSVPLYERLRHRPSTARYNTPLHSAHALTLRAAAIAVPGSADSTNAPGVVGVNESKPSTARPSSATVVVSGNGKSTNPASAGAIAGKAEPLSVQYSSLHSLSGYIDIGDAEVFQAAWVQPASEKLVIDHARQLKTEH